MNGSHIFAMRYFSVLVVLTWLAGCAAVHRPPATVDSIITDGNAARLFSALQSTL